MLIFESQREARGRTLRLLLAFGLAVLLLIVLVNAALALAWGLGWGFWIPGGAAYPRHFFAVNTGVVLLFVLGGWWVETSRLAHGGGVQLAEQLGARAAQPSSDPDERRFCHIVDEMAIAASMRPAPRAMVLARDTSINAFAAGWRPDDAAVAVTRGALESLTREELQGLVAHEFSHIVEGDTRLNMRLVGMVFGLEMLLRLGQHLFEPDARGRRSAIALIGLALMAAGWLGWLAGHALQAAVSRQREYLADARAVQWTRSRDGLGGVLRKALSQHRAAPVERASPSMVQHMLLVSDEAGAVAHWLDSHPPLEQRIRRLYGRTMPPLPPRRQDEPAVAKNAEAPAAAVAGPADAASGWTLS